MGYSHIYILPTPANLLETSTTTLATLTRNLSTAFPHTLITPFDEPWSLLHRLLRSKDDPTQPALGPKYQHVLRASFLGGGEKAYVWVDGNAAGAAVAGGSGADTNGIGTNKGTVVALPSSQFDPHTHFLAAHLSAQWTLGPSAKVEKGVSYKVGSYTVRMGILEVSRAGPASGASASSPGVVLCVTYDGGELGLEELNEEERVEVVREWRGRVRGFVGAMVPEGVRERVEGMGKEGKEGAGGGQRQGQGQGTGQNQIMEIMEIPPSSPSVSLSPSSFSGESFAARSAAVRMWCTALRLRH